MNFDSIDGNSRTQRPFLFAWVLTTLWLLESHNIAAGSNQKGSFDDRSSFVVGGVLLKDPAGMQRQIVSAPGIVLPARGHYKVKVEFLSDMKKPKWSTSREFRELDSQGAVFRRVMLYRETAETTKDCSTSECWVELKVFSISKGVSQEQSIDVSRKTRWLVTAWSPDNSPGHRMIRAGGSGQEWSVKTIQNNELRFEFPSEFGVTVITVSRLTKTP